MADSLVAGGPPILATPCPSNAHDAAVQSGTSSSPKKHLTMSSVFAVTGSPAPSSERERPAFLCDRVSNSRRLQNGADNSGRPRWIGAKSWEVGLCPPEHGSPSLVAAVITFGGVESRLQREGRDSDFPQNEAHKVTLVTSTPAPRMFIPLWYPGMVSAGRAR